MPFSEKTIAENAPCEAQVVNFNVDHECKGSRACNDFPKFSNQS